MRTTRGSSRPCARVLRHLRRAAANGAVENGWGSSSRASHWEHWTLPPPLAAPPPPRPRRRRRPPPPPPTPGPPPPARGGGVFGVGWGFVRPLGGSGRR